MDLNTGALAWLRTGQIYDLTQQRKLAMEAYGKPSRSPRRRKRHGNRAGISRLRTVGKKADSRPLFLDLNFNRLLHQLWRPCRLSSTMRARRPAVALAGILNLIAVAVWSDDLHFGIDFAVGQINFGDRILLQILPSDGDYIPGLAVPGSTVDIRGMACCA